MKKIALFLSLYLFLSTQLIALPAQILLLRHAEKVDTGNRLNTRGKERAAALVPFITETESLITFGPPVAIYAMSAPTGESSLRAIETVTPLATELKITIKDNFENDDFKNMIEDIKKNAIYHGKNVLICWDNKNIPEIARKFGALSTPFKWNNDIYDRVWVITFSSTGKATFQNIPQRLLFGDSAN